MIGKGALLLLAALALAGIYATYGISWNNLESEARLAKDEFEILARNAALAGLNRLEQKLAEEVVATGGSFSPATYTGSYDGYTYDAQIIQVSSTEARLRSRGEALTSRGDMVDFEVQATYEVTMNGDPGENAVPEALQEAVNSRCNVNLSGSMQVKGIDGRNANVRSDRGIAVGSGGGQQDSKGVWGYGYYGDSSEMPTNNNELRQLEDFFKPYDAVNAGDLVSVPPVPDSSYNRILTIMSDYRDEADVVIGMEEDLAQDLLDRVGTENVFGSVSSVFEAGLLGSPSNPLIIHVAGDLHLNTGAIPEYTIFVVDGNMKINGNVTVGENSETQRSAVAFYIDGDLTRANGAAEVWGQYFARGNIDMGNGTATINGNLTSLCNNSGSIAGSTNLTGNFTVNYYSANPLLSGGELTVSLERKQHSEW